MEEQINEARDDLLRALLLAGVTGDETFGELLDEIDRYVALSIRADSIGRGTRGGPAPGG